MVNYSITGHSTFYTVITIFSGTGSHREDGGKDPVRGLVGWDFPVAGLNDGCLDVRQRGTVGPCHCDRPPGLHRFSRAVFGSHICPILDFVHVKKM